MAEVAGLNRLSFLKMLGAAIVAPFAASIPFVKNEPVDDKPMTFGSWFVDGDYTPIEDWGEGIRHKSHNIGNHTYYIRADGCDSNCGTDCKPWKTL